MCWLLDSKFPQEKLHGMKSLFGMAMLGQPVRCFRWLLTASHAFPRFACLPALRASRTSRPARLSHAFPPVGPFACLSRFGDLRPISVRLRAACARRCSDSSPPSSRTSPSTTWSSRSWSALTLRTQPNSNQPTTWSSRYGSALQPPWLPLATRQIFPITRQASSLLLTVPWPRFTCHLWQVYMYLVTHAGEQPDLALLSINNFQARAQPSSEA